MIFVEQEQLHDPDNGVKGDCFSAVLASLLHIPLKHIPIFDNVDGVEGSWLIEVNKFLKPHGLAYVVFDHIESMADVFRFMQVEDCYHEMSGDSPRFPGTGHSCVGKDFKVIHDPHPTKLGLPKPTMFGLFICLQPWKMVGNLYSEDKNEQSNERS